MCSISGFSWDDRDLIKKMNKILLYRGPDDTGIYNDSKMSLGHNRLSIIDLTKAGHQPMVNKNGYLWIIFNGEIYNYRKIREDLILKGYEFQSNTDTEVVLYAYEEYGRHCLNFFNGMFAFAVWDTINKELFLARDRLGIKPLYYYYNGKNLIFSSEIKAILLHKINKEIDLNCLNSFLTYRFIPSNKTIFKEIRKLLPGHYAIFKDKTLSIKKYWTLKWLIENNSESYFIDLLKKLLFSSVNLRLNSEVPLGIFTSGGIDSSLVVAINSMLREDTINTFTVGFGHETDEFKYARKISDQFSTKHHEVIVNLKDVCLQLPRIIWQMDEPHFEMTIVPLYFLSEYAKNKITVVNTGEGADEIFSGYPLYWIGSNLFKPIPKFLKDYIYLWYYSPFKHRDRHKLFNFSFKNDETLKFYLKYANSSSFPNDFLNKLLNFDVKHELTNWELNRTDKIPMCHSMEARVPFLDHRIVEMSTKLPVKFKLLNLNTKYILKKLALKYLPRDIVFRKKQGFFVPQHTWIKQYLEDSIESILFNNKKPFFNYEFIRKLIKKHKNSKKQRPFQLISFQLLSLLFFDIWYELYINNKTIREMEQLLGN
ncbi:MAG: asparagine synthase (glutamine-hydrolyzing) [Candidatus Hermodarchaeota archaeon]